MKHIYWLLFAASLTSFYACNTEPAQARQHSADSDYAAPPPRKRKIKSADTLNKLQDSAWVNIKDYSDKILVDIRYATTDNFVGAKMYDCGECYMRAVVARALLAAQQELDKDNLRFKMFDCYRPRPYQQRLWDKVPDARYVTPPTKGSMHSKGAALDLTIADAQGKELDMGTPFDFFGEKAYPGYKKLPKKVLANRKLLQSTLEAQGFKGIRTEWWHFSYQSQSFKLSDWLWACR